VTFRPTTSSTSAIPSDSPSADSDLDNTSRPTGQGSSSDNPSIVATSFFTFQPTTLAPSGFKLNNSSQPTLTLHPSQRPSVEVSTTIRPSPASTSDASSRPTSKSNPSDAPTVIVTSVNNSLVPTINLPSSDSPSIVNAPSASLDPTNSVSQSSDSPSDSGTTLPAPPPTDRLLTEATWQEGSTFCGDDYFGWSVAVSNNASVIAVGSFFSQDGGKNSGRINIYEPNDGVSYHETGRILGNVDNILGHCISVSGDGSMMVAATSTNVHTYIRQEDGSWKTENEIIGRTNNSQFISKLALSDDATTLIVSEYKNYVSRSKGGIVRVYRRMQATWKQVGNDLLVDTVPSVDIPVTFSASGEYFAVGMASALKNGEGFVRIYRIIMENQWMQIGDDILLMKNIDRDENDVHVIDVNSDNTMDFDDTPLRLSLSLSKDGYRVAVGVSNNFGFVKVFRFDGIQWCLVGSTLDGTQRDERFGSSVQLSNNGQTLIVGSAGFDKYSDEHSGQQQLQQHNVGRVQIFRIVKQHTNKDNDDSDSEEWMTMGNDIVGDGYEDGVQHMGHALAVSEQGGVLVVGGAPAEVITNDEDSNDHYHHTPSSNVSTASTATMSVVKIFHLSSNTMIKLDE
jgi:FG-GAP repeat